MLRRCATCRFWTESNTYSANRRLCLKLGRFTSNNNFCNNYILSRKKVYCPVTNTVIDTIICRELNYPECKNCIYRQKLVSKRFNYKLIKEANMIDIQMEGRIILAQALNILKQSDLIDVPDELISQTQTATVEKLEEIINEFFDLVESITPDKESAIPSEVIDVYNRLVDGDIVFLSDQIDEDHKIFSSNGMFSFRRKNLER